jgi:hypothetical protein
VLIIKGRVFLGVRYSKEEGIVYGGISKAVGMGLRSSERIRAQPNSDASQLECARLQAQAKDPSDYLGTKALPNFTLASFSNSQIETRASKLGVSLGDSPSKVLK